MITRIEQPKGWNSSNLYDVPPVNGVYVLRDQNQNILFIGSVGSRHLRDRLIGHLQVNDVPGVRYFEWYQTDGPRSARSEEHTSELQSLAYLVCRLLLEKKKNKQTRPIQHNIHEPKGPKH